MNIRPIPTEDEYRAAPADISALTEADPAPDTPESDRLAASPSI